MTASRNEIDLSAAGPIVDDASAASGVGVTLGFNAAHALEHRVNRCGAAYVAGWGAADDTDPPGAGEGLQQYSDHASAGDSPTKALTIVTPPNGPLFLPLGEFPLSPHASSIRVVVGMGTLLGDVEVYAFAAFGRNAVPMPPAVILGDYGVASFAPRVVAQDCYRLVGTDAMSDGSTVRPVVLDIPLGARSETYARRGPGPTACNVWLAIMSKQSTLYGSDTIVWYGRTVGIDFGKGVGATGYWLLRDGRQMHGALAVISEGGTWPESRTLIHPPGPSGEFATSAYAATMATIYAWTVSEVIG